MIDFLYRFNVLNTAFSVIGSEIKETFGQVGGCWHMCLFIWTMYFGLQELWTDSLKYNIQYISGFVFLVASKYLLFMQNVIQKIEFLRFLDFGIPRKIASFTINISIFPVLWFFAFVPFYQGVSSMIMLITGADGSRYGGVVSLILMLTVSALICTFKRKTGAPVAKTSNTLKTRSRPPSARITARQNQAKKPRPASTTPLSRQTY